MLFGIGSVLKISEENQIYFGGISRIEIYFDAIITSPEEAEHDERRKQISKDYRIKCQI